LFERSRRDLSHGCIRVEHPAALAQYVLAGQRQWNADTIQEALQPGPTKHVDLARSIPVVLFYATAGVDGEGKARFAPDIYGRDVKLERDLAARRGALQAVIPAQAGTGVLSASR
jgi:murein L,D-transpeptidase YcbB/YkuD